MSFAFSEVLAHVNYMLRRGELAWAPGRETGSDDVERVIVRDEGRRSARCLHRGSRPLARRREAADRDAASRRLTPSCLDHQRVSCQACPAA